MNRREFITLLGGAAVAWPLAVRAQQPAVPVVGFLHSASPGPFARAVDAFRKGLSETGYIEGRNVVVEYRWAEGQYNRLPALAADLVRRQVSVIVAVATNGPAQAAKAATASIPIVFVTGGDPVLGGLVASLNRPAGNITGVTWVATALVSKQLELLRGSTRNPALIGALVNPTHSDHDLRPEGRRHLRRRVQDGCRRDAGDLSAKRRDRRAPAFPGAHALWTGRAGRGPAAR